ncbi:hypothetical protein AVEN_5347-1 [Araneus ventricosus]|uniref:Uncharacterized protein n=1 Tax=Araneus ventricosus TaxID=182803 RepID=A0A4Y2QB04_ARAVE|nr:hypothetical protein AVEN_5347-1 [Araneus ventricosus]
MHIRLGERGAASLNNERLSSEHEPLLQATTCKPYPGIESCPLAYERHAISPVANPLSNCIMTCVMATLTTKEEKQEYVTPRVVDRNYRSGASVTLRRN